MKKLFLLPVALLFTCSFAVAQQFYAGVTAGASATQISGDQLSGFNKAGIVAGGYVGTGLSPTFDIELGILFIQKGSRKNADPENGDYITYLLRLNYFEFPLMMQWKFSKRLSLEAGPTVAALVGFSEEDEFGELTQPREFKNIEIGVAGGMNFLLIKQLAVNFRYQNSLLPVRDHLSGQGYRLNQGQYNTSMVFALKYTFGKGTDE